MHAVKDLRSQRPSNTKDPSPGPGPLIFIDFYILRTLAGARVARSACAPRGATQRGTGPKTPLPTARRRRSLVSRYGRSPCRWRQSTRRGWRSCLHVDASAVQSQRGPCTSSHTRPRQLAALALAWFARFRPIQMCAALAAVPLLASRHRCLAIAIDCRIANDARWSVGSLWRRQPRSCEEPRGEDRWVSFQSPENSCLSSLVSDPLLNLVPKNHSPAPN